MLENQQILDRIDSTFNQSIEVKKHFLEHNKPALVDVVRLVSEALKKRQKLLVFGNGGSSCDAQHFVGEFVTRFMHDRDPLPAIALTADSSILTSCANDYSYEVVFERQVRALGQAGDVAVGISTSGKSKNVILGLEAAKKRGLVTVALTGNDGGEVGKIADYHINVGIGRTPRIQETHIVVLHLIAEMVDKMLYNLPYAE